MCGRRWGVVLGGRVDGLRRRDRVAWEDSSGLLLRESGPFGEALWVALRVAWARVRCGSSPSVWLVREG